MTNLEKMNELAGSKADKEQIKQWAYMNRVFVGCLYDEPEFYGMERTVIHFMESDFYTDNFEDETKLWDGFLDFEYVS